MERSPLWWLLALGALVFALEAAAQGRGLGVHAPLGPTERPLHERVALADAAAVGTVDAVDVGRIRVREAIRIFGDVGERFELKRAPSRPPPLAPGDRVLLLLRGARSPYLVVDEPEELRAFVGVGADAARTWSRALRALREAGERPRALRALYAGWLEGDDDTLRAAARSGLSDPGAPFQPLDDAYTLHLVEVALDAGAPAATRRAAASVAVRSRTALRALLARVPGDGSDADAEVLLAALRAGALLRDPGLTAVLGRSLEHPDADVRRAALRFAAAAPIDDPTRAALEHLSRSDPEEDLRRSADRLLQRARRAERPR